MWTDRFTGFGDRTGWTGKAIAIVLIAGMAFLSVVYFVIVGVWLYHHV